MSFQKTKENHGCTHGKDSGPPVNTNGDNDLSRCTKCVLPRSVRYLNFDSEGVCNLCRSGTKQAERTATEQPDSIEQILERVRQFGKGRKYDCLVGLSGGRDSSYLLHQLVRKHGLRCLAAFYPTPFTDKVIYENVVRLVGILNVPLVRINLSHEFHRRYAVRMMRLWKNRPSVSVANLVCAPCKYLNRETFKIARKNDIKSIIYGGNYYEEFQFGGSAVEYNPGRHMTSFLSQAKKMFFIAIRGASLLARHPSLLLRLPTAFKASILYLNPHTPYLRIRYPDILRIDYFLHVKYNEEECVKVITSELGWQLPRGCNCYWRADCSMAEVKNLMFDECTGTDYFECYLSNMIRSGDITRQEALHRLQTEGKVSTQRLYHAAKVMDLSLDFLLKNAMSRGFFSETPESPTLMPDFMPKPQEYAAGRNEMISDKDKRIAA